MVRSMFTACEALRQTCARMPLRSSRSAALNVPALAASATISARIGPASAVASVAHTSSKFVTRVKIVLGLAPRAAPADDRAGLCAPGGGRPERMNRDDVNADAPARP